MHAQAWVAVSKSWAALESIFLASADIRSQLPDDTKVGQSVSTHAHAHTHMHTHTQRFEGPADSPSLP